MNFNVNNQKHFQTNSAVHKEQAPSSHTKWQPLMFSEKRILCWHQHCQQSILNGALVTSLKELKNKNNISVIFSIFEITVT
jgi:hypothetical protein